MSKRIFEIADMAVTPKQKQKVIQIFAGKIKELEPPKTFFDVTMKRSLKAGIMYLLTKK
jgi:hypothetical protein